MEFKSNTEAIIITRKIALKNKRSLEINKVIAERVESSEQKTIIILEIISLVLVVAQEEEKPKKVVKKVKIKVKH